MHILCRNSPPSSKLDKITVERDQSKKKNKAFEQTGRQSYGSKVRMHSLVTSSDPSGIPFSPFKSEQVTNTNRKTYTKFTQLTRKFQFRHSGRRIRLIETLLDTLRKTKEAGEAKAPKSKVPCNAFAAKLEDDRDVKAALRKSCKHVRGQVISEDGLCIVITTNLIGSESIRSRFPENCDPNGDCPGFVVIRDV